MHKRMKKVEVAENHRKRQQAQIQNAAIFAGFHAFIENEERFRKKAKVMRKVENEFESQKVIAQVSCPRCNEETSTTRCKRWDTNCFSNLRCRQCGETSSTKEWRCICGYLWYKCPFHKIADKRRPKTSPCKTDLKMQRRKLMVLKLGTKTPKPQNPMEHRILWYQN